MIERLALAAWRWPPNRDARAVSKGLQSSDLRRARCSRCFVIGICLLDSARLFPRRPGQIHLYFSVYLWQCLRLRSLAAHMLRPGWIRRSRELKTCWLCAMKIYGKTRYPGFARMAKFLGLKVDRRENRACRGEQFAAEDAGKGTQGTGPGVDKRSFRPQRNGPRLGFASCRRRKYG